MTNSGNILWLLLVAVAACSTTPNSSTIDMRSSADGAMSVDGTGGIDGPTGDGSTSSISVSYCVQGCTTAANCALDNGAYSASHYTCTGGGCQYNGCQTSSACAASSVTRPICL